MDDTIGEWVDKPALSFCEVIFLSKLEKRLWELTLPVTEQAGVTLYDLMLVREGAQWYFRIFIDKENGVTIEDCERVSRAMSNLLDETDPISQQYLLEVSSPGLDRLLRLPQHFENAIGEAVEVHLFSPIEKKKLWEGVLAETSADTITLAFEDAPSRIFEKDKIASVRVIPDLDW